MLGCNYFLWLHPDTLYEQGCFIKTQMLNISEKNWLSKDLPAECAAPKM
jgi:hypothetical protein